MFRSRQEYTELLLKDLCTYFSYNTFLMEKMMHLFPLEDLMSFLEASETPRPVTIRTNSLKTRRRDLAQVNIFNLYNHEDDHSIIQILGIDQPRS